MKRSLSLIVIAAALLFCACGPDPDATDPAPFDDDTPAARTEQPVTDWDEEGSEAVDTGTDTDTQTVREPSPEWLVYQEARDATLAIDEREYQTMVYTRLESGSASMTQSINIKVRYSGANTASPAIAATGTVKARDRMIDIEMYYRDGSLYSCSGESRNRQETYFDAAASEMDVLHVFRRELTYDIVTDISVEESMDGTKQVSLAFRGPINGLDTTGSGEIVISPSGLVVSEGYSLTSVSDGKKTSQSVEVILTGYGSDLPGIEFPDLSVY